MNPIDHFNELFELAKTTCSEDPTAMVLSTVGLDGRPAARFVLLRGVDERGFVFYTNLESRKGCELEAHPYAALCIFWAAIGRQVRIEGTVDQVSAAEADAYFSTRVRESQIGAWASRQSARLGSRDELEQRVREFEAQFQGQPVPRPPFWSGFRVVPSRIEFWSSRAGRLHERIVYLRSADGWNAELLFP